MIKKSLAAVLLMCMSVSAFGYFSYTVALANNTEYPMVLTQQLHSQMTWNFPAVIDPGLTVQPSYDFWLSNVEIWGDGFKNDGGIAVYAIQCPNGEVDQLTLKASVSDDWHYNNIEEYLHFSATLTGEHCTMLANGNNQSIIPARQSRFALQVEQKPDVQPTSEPDKISQPDEDEGCCD